jgi:hypothetical protein
MGKTYSPSITLCMLISKALREVGFFGVISG